MKKTTVYIISILLLAITITGGTFAFYQSATTSGNDVISEEASNFAVIYNQGEEINGPINIINDTDDNLKLKTTVRIRVSEDSVNANAQLFINLEEITTNLTNEAGLKWQIKGYINNTLKYTNQGTFESINPISSDKCTKTDNKITCKEGYKIPIIGIDTSVPLIVTKDEIIFDIYFWLDGNLVDNRVLGGQFKGNIGAMTERFTADLQ